MAAASMRRNTTCSTTCCCATMTTHKRRPCLLDQSPPSPQSQTLCMRQRSACPQEPRGWRATQRTSCPSFGNLSKVTQSTWATAHTRPPRCKPATQQLLQRLRTRRKLWVAACPSPHHIIVSAQTFSPGLQPLQLQLPPQRRQRRQRQHQDPQQSQGRVAAISNHLP